MMAEVRCHGCGRAGLGELPEAAPAGWAVIFVNRVFGGRGGGWRALCCRCDWQERDGMIAITATGRHPPLRLSG